MRPARPGGDRVSGLKRARIVWTVVFLGITLVAIVMEVVAGVWHVAGTIPWTEYLAQYVPWPFQLIAYVVLVVWLPFHFWRHDHMRKAAYNHGYRAGRLDHGAAYDLGRMAGWHEGRSGKPMPPMPGPGPRPNAD